jgi:hypothetical protein
MEWRRLPVRGSRPPIWHRGCGRRSGALIAEHLRRGVGWRYAASYYFYGEHYMVGWFPGLADAKQTVDRELRAACRGKEE